MKEFDPERDPAVRARSAQDTIKYLEEVRPGSRAELEALLPSGHLDAIQKNTSGAFIPLELDAVMGEGIVTLLGTDGAIRFWTEYAAHHMKSPLLKGLVRTAMSLLGARPFAFFKWMPRGLSTVFRNAFEARVEAITDDRAVLRLEVTSDVFLRSPVYPIILEGIARATFDLTGASGEIWVERDVAARTFRIEARWKES